MIRTRQLIHDGIDMSRLVKRGRENAFKLLFLTLVIGLCFSILYPVLKILPQVFCDFSDLGNPDIIWVPVKTSLLSFTAAVRLGFADLSAMFLTLLYCAVISVIQIMISAFAGYSLGRVDFPFRKVVMALVVVTIIVPPQALLISQFLRFKHFDVFGVITLFNGHTVDLIDMPYTLYILALTGFGVKQSIFVFIFRQFFMGLPRDLEEAALIDGCGFYKTFFRIVFPNAVPAITTIATLAFVWNYGDTYYTGYFHPDGPYLANSLLRVFTTDNTSIQRILDAVRLWYSVPAVSTFTFDAIKYAAALIFLSPLLVLYFIAQKRLVENFERSGIVG
jgi:multiple sugar transport system permease protein